MNYRIFEELDWMAFAGAESFSDGTPPLMGVAEVEIAGLWCGAMVIADSKGLQIFNDGDNGDLLCAISNFPLTAEYARAVLNGLGEKIPAVLIRQLGFGDWFEV